MIGALRGLAALAVVTFHVINAPIGFETNGFVRGLAVNGAHGVQVFFVISGLVIPLSLMRKGYRWPGLGRFMWKRSIRLEPTYLVVLLASLAMLPARAWVIGEPVEAFPTMQELLLNVFYLIPFTDYDWMNSVFWTLGIELQFYLLCAVLFGLKRKSVASGLIYALPFASALLASVTTKMFVTHWLDFFLAGGFVAMHIEGRISKEKLGVLLILCHLSAGMTHGHYFASILTLTVLVILFLPNRNGGRILQFLGRQSYSLYLIHTLVGITIVNAAMRYTDHQYPLVHWGVILVAVLASVGAAQLLYVLVERPTMNWSKKVQVNSSS